MCVHVQTQRTTSGSVVCAYMHATPPQCSSRHFAFVRLHKLLMHYRAAES